MYKIRLSNRLCHCFPVCIIVALHASLKPRTDYEEKSVPFRNIHPNGQEFADMKPDLTLNLGLQEYLTAVKDQPKPLIIPLCA